MVKFKLIKGQFHHDHDHIFYYLDLQHLGRSNKKNAYNLTQMRTDLFAFDLHEDFEVFSLVRISTGR